jgi:hypothetical protein
MRSATRSAEQGEAGHAGPDLRIEVFRGTLPEGQVESVDTIGGHQHGLDSIGADDLGDGVGIHHLRYRQRCHLRQVIGEQPERRVHDGIEGEHRHLPRHPRHLAQTGEGVAPVVDGEHRHRRVEGTVGEWEVLGHAPHHRCGPGGALAGHDQ